MYNILTTFTRISFLGKETLQTYMYYTIWDPRILVFNFQCFLIKYKYQLQNITHINMEAYNHLLWFVCGLYMATATLLNRHLYTGVRKHFSFYTEQSHFYDILTYLACSVKINNILYTINI